MLRQRAQQRRPHTAPPGRREDARREKTLPREVGTAGDSRTGSSPSSSASRKRERGVAERRISSTLPQRSFGMTVIRTCRQASKSLSVGPGGRRSWLERKVEPAAPLDGLRGEPEGGVQAGAFRSRPEHAEAAAESVRASFMRTARARCRSHGGARVPVGCGPTQDDCRSEEAASGATSTLPCRERQWRTGAVNE